MVWIDYQFFVHSWLNRAKRRGECVDDGDRFISLWIAFNGWMKAKFGENKTDKKLIEALKGLEDMKGVFDDLRRKDDRFAAALKRLGRHQVADMRDPGAADKTKQYDGSYEALMDTIYQIRCNLFHGRKEVSDNKKDIELVTMAYAALLPLFEEYLQRYGCR